MSRRGEAWGLAFAYVVEAGCAAVWAWAVGMALRDRQIAQRLMPPAAGTRSLGRPLPSVAVIVPARDEASNIGAWVDSVRRQTYPDLRVVIADDESSDGTSEVAAVHASGDPRFEILRCPAKPRGWTGKSWAAHAGAQRTSAEWLLFSDADMRMAPDTVTAAVEAAIRLDADALSLTTTLECGSLAEAIVMPVVACLIFAAYPICLIQDERFATALMWGGFMLVRRDAYDKAGGHEAIRAEIAEDRAMAERLKAFGYRVRLLDGSRLVRVRMYAGLASMWEGWRKNIFEGVRRNPVLAALFVAGNCALLIAPMPLLAALGAARLRRRLTKLEQRLMVLCAFGALSAVLVRAVRDELIGADTRTAVATPLAGAFTCAVMAAAAFRSMTGRGQTWKGRTIG